MKKLNQTLIAALIAADNALEKAEPVFAGLFAAAGATSAAAGAAYLATEREDVREQAKVAAVAAAGLATAAVFVAAVTGAVHHLTTAVTGQDRWRRERDNERDGALAVARWSSSETLAAEGASLGLCGMELLLRRDWLLPGEWYAFMTDVGVFHARVTRQKTPSDSSQLFEYGLQVPYLAIGGATHDTLPKLGRVTAVDGPLGEGEWTALGAVLTKLPRAYEGDTSVEVRGGDAHFEWADTSFRSRGPAKSLSLRIQADNERAPLNVRIPVIQGVSILAIPGYGVEYVERAAGETRVDEADGYANS